MPLLFSASSARSSANIFLIVISTKTSRFSFLHLREVANEEFKLRQRLQKMAIFEHILSI